jgi:M6 family metalloprotease-like protein
MKKYLLISFTTALLSISGLLAVPASPFPVVRILPDGSTITVLLKGDEFFKYSLTTDGYYIQKKSDGYFYYMKTVSENEFSTSDVRANNPEKRNQIETEFIKNLIANPDLTVKAQKSRVMKIKSSGTSFTSQSAFPRTGSPKSIVILANFKDVTFNGTDPATAFSNLLNQEGYSANGGTGSARDYFKTSSFGVSSPDFVVVGPVTLPNNREYYGKNDSNGDDVKPREMVIDACKAASAMGVDFTTFDTDADGVVDNVFIYYAGHNEAEGGPENSIWPHRWSLANPLTLNGKYISDYACTSELRSSSGTSMCGIGTFCHEFGHVYGLPDYYATDGSTHQTLSYWNIMDAGPYLNFGRTPPSYSAYDRFYLGWLTPVILKSPLDVSIPDLKTTNKAFLITQSGSHNLNGASPIPSEFFILENRQKTGWDTYLPKSGMLITRINYNSSTWEANTPNNISYAMGVDIIEADGIASDGSLIGDPFPGSKNVTFYNPTLRSGIVIGKPLTNITESGGIITFNFMGGGNPPQLFSDSKKLTQFKTTLGIASAIQSFGISGKKLQGNISIGFTNQKHFEIRKAGDTNWSKNIELTAVNGVTDSTTIEIRYNPTDASYNDTHFEYLNINSDNADLIQVVISGKSSRPVYVVPPVANAATETSLGGYDASWNLVYDAKGYYLTAYNITPGTSTIKEGFEKGLQASPGWIIQASTAIANQKYAGDTIPAIQLKNSGEYIQTEKVIFPVSGFSFFAKSIGEISGTLKVEAFNGQDWKTIAQIPVTSTLDSVFNYKFDDTGLYKSFRLSFTKGISSVAIDDISIQLAERVEFDLRNEWIVDNHAYVEKLIPGRNYFYYVQASDKTLNTDQTIKYENITASSNIIEITPATEKVLQEKASDESISIFIDENGNAILNLIKIADEQKTIRVYTSEGRLHKTIETRDNAIKINDLSPGRIYFIRVGDATLKFVR